MGLELNTFLDRMLAHVPEDKKAEVRAEYSKAQDLVRTTETSLEAATRAVQDTATKQTNWWEANKDVVADRNRLATELAAAKANPAGGIDSAEFDKRLAASRGEVLETGLGLVTEISTLAMQHYQEFGEVLDTRKMTEEALKAGTTVRAYHDQSVAERRQKRDTDLRAKEIADAEARGATRATEELLKRTGAGMPYPVGTSAPTTLAGLRKPAEGAGNQYGLEAAVATANRVAAQQSGT